MALPWRRPRRAWSALLVTVSATVSVALPVNVGPATATAAATAPAPLPYPFTRTLGVSGESRLVDADGELFVSEGVDSADVLIFSTSGRLLHDVVNQSGASGMVVSPDGSEVYVALAGSDEISAIDTTTFVTTTFTVDSCPTDLALASGRLFYAYGCGAKGAGGVSSIDPTSGGTPVSALTGLSAAPLLAGAGNTLAVVLPHVSPTSVKTYQTASTGDLTLLAHITVPDEPTDLSMSSTGNRLVTAASTASNLLEYDTSNLQQTNKYVDVSSPGAVTISPEGRHVIAGMQSSTDLVNFYPTSSTAKVLPPTWRRVGVLADPKSWNRAQADEVLPGSLAFSSGGKHVYGLVDTAGSAGVSLFASSTTPKAMKLKVAVTTPAADHPVAARATLSGPGKVTFSTTSDKQTMSLGTVTANSKHLAKVGFASTYSGSLHTVFEGNQFFYPAMRSSAYTVPSTSKVTLSGSYENHDGVKRFHARKDVNIRCAVIPVGPKRSIKATLAYYSRGKWRSVASISDSLASDGSAELAVDKIAIHEKARITMTFAGDSLNGASHDVSEPFEVS